MSMICPTCDRKARCIDTRPAERYDTRRRYACKRCKTRWSTLEQLVRETERGTPLKATMRDQLKGEVRTDIQAELRHLFGIQVDVPAGRRKRNGFAGVDIDRVHRKRT